MALFSRKKDKYAGWTALQRTVEAQNLRMRGEESFALSVGRQKEVKLKEALEFFETAVELDAWNADAWDGKKKVLKRMGLESQAHACDLQARSARAMNNSRKGR
jgi:hypothetical protein